MYSFYAHAHETTPTSGYKLSHTHIVVEKGPWSVGCVCFGLYLSCLLLKFWIVASILVSSCFVCFWICGREVSLPLCARVSHCHTVNWLLHLLASFDSPLQSPRLEKHLCLVCPYPLRDRRVVVGGRRSGRPWLGPGLVWVVCASLSLFRQFFTIAGTRETLWYLIYPSPRRSSWDTSVETIMAVMDNQACMVFDFFFLFIAWHFETTIALRKRERNILVPFSSMYTLWFSS